MTVKKPRKRKAKFSIAIVVFICMLLCSSCKEKGNVYKNESFQIEVLDGWYIYEYVNVNSPEKTHEINPVTLVKSEEDYKINPHNRLSFVTIREFFPTKEYPYEETERQYIYDINGNHWEGFDIPINNATYTIFTEIDGRYFSVAGQSFEEGFDPRYHSVSYDMEEVKEIIKTFKVVKRDTSKDPKF